MFRNLFRPDSPLMITLTQITDCIFLSLFFIVGCVPVVTAGASFAALYDATFRGFRRGEKHPWKRFWQVYGQNWKGSILPTALFLLCVWALVKGEVALWNGAALGKLSWAVFSAGSLGVVFAVGILSVGFPLLSRFENPFGAWMKNTVILSLANAPRTLVLGILNAAGILLCLRYIFPLFFLPSLAALLGSLLIEPMFKPYLPGEG